MDRKQLMRTVEQQAFEARIGLSALCAKANLSRTIAYRWQKKTGVPTLPTIGKLEIALAAHQAEQS